VPKEITPGECRVAATPKVVKRLIKMGFEVSIEAGAGVAARYADSDFEAAGAQIALSFEALYADADIVIKVNPPTETADGGHEADRLREGGTLISLIMPAQNEALVERLAARKATVLALDCIPRISRAQKMDVLSSMANIAGYRAIIEAANNYAGFFTGQMTAAGKTPPAKVLVIGAGVAGLAAIGAARSLGAIVRAFDTRPAAREQVRSLGAEFLEVEIEEDGTGQGGYAKVMSQAFIDAEMELFRRQCDEVDIIVTTALIPGRPAPKLILHDMVERLRPGSVIVDLAAQNGGNCEDCVPGEVVEVDGVKIIGLTDLTSRMANHASQFFGNNIAHLLEDMGGGTEYRVDEGDEAVRGALVLLDGKLMWPPPKVEAPPPAPKPTPKVTPAPAPAAVAHAPAPKSSSHGHGAPKASSRTLAVVGVIGAVVFTVVGVYAPTAFIQHFTVFVLACFIGYQVVWNVTPALHTPLMSVTNAISGIIIVGGILTAIAGDLNAAAWVGLAAILVASVNVFGGFLVTHRMLQMFRK
jgi:NAD(P) transhydrogenase subunit alpha